MERKTRAPAPLSRNIAKFDVGTGANVSLASFGAFALHDAVKKRMPV